METVYVETTVLSYVVSRPSRDVVIAGHQQVTVEWWNDHRLRFECFVSQAVLDEIAAGDVNGSQKRTSLAGQLGILEITKEAEDLARQILASGVIPPKAARDAAHIAVATDGGMDYLLTWNCTHIANAQILRKIEKICEAAGYLLPVICTPEELMAD